MSVNVNEHQQQDLPHVITKEDIDKLLAELDMLFTNAENNTRQD
ncbi:hypothetical protein [Gracilibacillus dipsosauri]|nr:hypothetical protein [Gracilibacillus dipsosauri]